MMMDDGYCLGMFILDVSTGSRQSQALGSFTSYHPIHQSIYPTKKASGSRIRLHQIDCSFKARLISSFNFKDKPFLLKVFTQIRFWGTLNQEGWLVFECESRVSNMMMIIVPLINQAFQPINGISVVEEPMVRLLICPCFSSLQIHLLSLILPSSKSLLTHSDLIWIESSRSRCSNLVRDPIQSGSSSFSDLINQVISNSSLTSRYISHWWRYENLILIWVRCLWSRYLG